MPNRLQQLHDAGVSVWLDFIERPMLHNGELERRIRDDALTGMTSNPTIFEKALAEGTAYDDQVRAAPRDLSPLDLFELVETTDVRDACDLFRGVYERSKGGDGYVSIEVSPGAAHDTKATIDEARRLWRTVDRPNVMIKVPGTEEGAKAVRTLIGEGINVNITLLFGIERYEEVARAYIEGLSLFVQDGGDPALVCSVASFFVSRIDTMVDELIGARLAKDAGAATHACLSMLLGTVAIANAKLAYQRYLELCSSTEWQALAARGAHPQRLLWASTSTKNARYRDVRYVEELIGRETVSTITPATLEAFRDHGRLRPSLEENVRDAQDILDALALSGVSLRDVTDKLLDDGVTLFRKAFDHLLEVVGAGGTEITPKSPALM